MKVLGLFAPGMRPKEGSAEAGLIAETLESAHEWLAYGLAALVGVHIVAALKHTIVDRDGVLARILPWRAGRDYP